MINDFLTLKETVGEGAFCKVKKAIGIFNDEND